MNWRWRPGKIGQKKSRIRARWRSTPSRGSARNSELCCKSCSESWELRQNSAPSLKIGQRPATFQFEIFFSLVPPTFIWRLSGVYGHFLKMTFCGGAEDSYPMQNLFGNEYCPKLKRIDRRQSASDRLERTKITRRLNKTGFILSSADPCCEGNAYAKRSQMMIA